jgi:hypothetical protein
MPGDLEFRGGAGPRIELALSAWEAQRSQLPGAPARSAGPLVAVVDPSSPWSITPANGPATYADLGGADRSVSFFPPSCSNLPIPGHGRVRPALRNCPHPGLPWNPATLAPTGTMKEGPSDCRPRLRP